MKRLLFAITVIFFYMVSLHVLVLADELKVVAGTSLEEDIVTDLTSNRAAIVTLIAGSSCPGHNDLKASDIIFVSSADVALLHTFQIDLPPVKNIFASANNKNLRIETISAEGNWMAPPVQIQATIHIGQILSEIKPEWAKDIEAKTNIRLKRIEDAEARAKKILNPLSNLEVIAAKMQADFVSWAGLTVVGEYERAENMSPKTIIRLLESARGKKIIGVIDNLQSGADAGIPIANELKVPHLVLSNFPGSLQGINNYFDLLNYNIKNLSYLITGS